MKKGESGSQILENRKRKREKEDEENINIEEFEEEETEEENIQEFEEEEQGTLNDTTTVVYETDEEDMFK